MSIKKQYEIAKNIYKNFGVDTDLVLERLKKVKISLQCWQGDDINGFLNKDSQLTGGIQVTGNYPRRGRTPDELRHDLEIALSLIPGKHKVNLHAIYLDTDEIVDLDNIQPYHFDKWVAWAKKHQLGLDFNPTCFAHDKSSTGFTLSSKNNMIREFWIKHCQLSRKVGEYFGRELGQKSIVNIWIPDGYKDNPIDRYIHREILKKSLDQIYSEKIDEKYVLDTMESKLFGIGTEAYTTGSNEFYLGYAVLNHKAVCLDMGHFHPTESVADKISSVLLYTEELLLHVSRPMRWDSDHVVILDDELNKLAEELVRNNLIDRTHLGLDYFDASINRVAAWVIGVRSLQKALLKAMLEPTILLKSLEKNGNFTERLALIEELKTLPYGIVYDYFCELEGVKTGGEWINTIREYESKYFKGVQNK